eukprot:2548497-Pleurochrysis_carterae.AAC.1
MVVRSCRSVSSQICKSRKHRGVSSSRGESKLGWRERNRERWRSEGGEGVERKRRCRAVRRKRVKQCIVSNKVAKVVRPDPVHPRAQIVMVRVPGGHCERSPQARVGALALEERVRHREFGRE